MGMFKRRKSSGSAGRASPHSTSSYPAYGSYDQRNLSPRSSASAPVIGYGGNKKKKKKGLRSKLKGLVKGGRRSLSAGNISVGGDSRSSFDSYDHNHNHNGLLKPPPKVKRMPHRLERGESSSYSSYSSDEEDDHFRNPLGTVTEVNEDDYDSDGELRVKPTRQQQQQQHGRHYYSPASPSANSNTTNTRRRINPSRSQRLGGGIKNQVFVEETISVVILLVDPNSKRFELIQLQPNNHNQRQELTIKKVLKQFKKTITEPSLKKLSFVGLVDRQGIIHKPSARLSTAMGGFGDQTTKTKDILVGLVQGVQTDQLLQTVRPILGDPKMGKLLDMNGFDTKGWVKKKKTKDSILDKKKPSLVQEEKQGSALAIFAFTCVILAILVCVDKLLVHLDSSGAFVQPLMDWPTVVENAGGIAKQGVQAAKEAYLHGNNTALVAMANSTYAVVEETALEAVSDTRAIVKDLVPIVQEYVTTTSSSLDSAKDIVMTAALLPVAEVVTEARTNITESIANVTESIANVTESIANSTKEAIMNNAVKTTNIPTPNSVWEDYLLIGLLVCWLLYWMAI